MWEFSKTVNQFLNKELVTKDNESKFLSEFKKACDDQIGLSDDMFESGSRYKAEIKIWQEILPVSFDVSRDEDGLLSTIDEEIKLPA